MRFLYVVSASLINILMINWAVNDQYLTANWTDHYTNKALN